jgi:receptor protein-tyrosine kinase
VLAGKISSTVEEDTVILGVRVTDPSPARAQQIADAVARHFSRVVSDLETPPGGTTAPLKVSVIKSASLSSTPVSPRISLNTGIGLFLGLVAGVAFAALREALDGRIRTRQLATELTNAPVLATLPVDSRSAVRPLVVQDDAFSVRTEAFRQLRTNLRYVSVDQQVRRLVITSSRDGEGKSSTAANLAIALAHAGHRVVLIDADLRRPKLATYFGLNPGIGLTDVLVGGCDVQEALQQWRPNLPLALMTSGATPPNPSELLGSRRMGQTLAALDAVADYVIIDSPPLLPVADASVLAPQSDGVLMIIDAVRARRDGVSNAVEMLHTVGADIRGVVLNRVKRRRSTYGYGYTYTQSGRTGGKHSAERPFPAQREAVSEPESVGAAR